MKPNVFHPGTKIGRYTTVSDTVRTFTRNHPFNLVSTHGFFYNPALGFVKGDQIEFNKLVIGNGAWIGHNALVLPPTESIGDGAIVRPGAVVYSNIPPFAVVSGHPARITGYRFNRDTISRILASRWWERPPGDISNDVSACLAREESASPPEAAEITNV